MKIIVILFIGYFLGSIPFSFITSKYMGKIDIREFGSGNSGATNVYRILGKKAGAIAFIGDFLKGLLAALIGKAILGTSDGAAICGGLAIIGHCYPVWIGFKGGKGVATTAGMILGMNPLLWMIVLVIQFTIIGTTKYVSLASIVSASLLPVISLLLNLENTFVIYTLLIGAFVVFRHKENLGRLIRGEEKKISSKKAKEA